MSLLGQDFFSPFSFSKNDSAGDIIALLLVEAIRCGNNLNLLVVFHIFFS